MKKDLNIYSHMFMRSFPTAEESGERKCEGTSLKIEEVECQRLAPSVGKKQPLGTLTDNGKGGDRFQGFWKIHRGMCRVVK